MAQAESPMAQAMFRASEWRALENHMDLFTRMRAFGRDDSGQDLLEYALLVGLIALVTVLAVTNAGSEVNRIFGAIVTSLTAVA